MEISSAFILVFVILAVVFTLHLLYNRSTRTTESVGAELPQCVTQYLEFTKKGAPFALIVYIHRPGDHANRLHVCMIFPGKEKNLEEIDSDTLIMLKRGRSLTPVDPEDRAHLSAGKVQLYKFADELRTRWEPLKQDARKLTRDEEDTMMFFRALFANQPEVFGTAFQSIISHSSPGKETTGAPRLTDAMQAVLLPDRPPPAKATRHQSRTFSRVLVATSLRRST